MTQIDWSDDTTVRNAFVEAVHAGDHAAASRAGETLVSSMFDGSVIDDVASGALLPEDLIPQDPDSAPYDSPGLELLDGLVAEDRLAELYKGGDMSAVELTLWQRKAAEHILASPELDWDTYSMWAVRCVRHTDGREAYLADVGGGYSFTGPWSEYRGGAVTLEKALALLKPY